ncbi:MAG: right-handed parallel beta-helix repeat-containing protein, partial [Myxococcales bacterium]|nr:right-handed parallel beta-helix repeat-containing protein [Myxococcales bacterium]
MAGPPAAAASVLYVDGDAHAEAPPDQCPGDGSDASPFRSLDCAFASGAVRAGTAIQLRDAATPYAGVDSADHALPSGAALDPIVIEPAPGHAPILTGPLALHGLSFWTVRDLVFDGSGGAPSSEAIRITAPGGTAVAGVTIEGVTIRAWPGRGIVLRGTSTLPLSASTIQGCRIEGAEDAGLWLEHVAAILVVSNEISELRCTAYAPFTLCDECGAGQCAPCGDCLDEPLETCGATSDHEIGGQTGVRVLGDSTGVSLERNHFHDFLEDDCGAEGTRTAAIFVTAAGARDGLVTHNLIERIAPGNPDNGYGILMYQSAPGWQIEHNVLYDIGHCGLCEGDWLFHGSRQTRWWRNTVIGTAGAGIDVRWAAELEVAGNLVVDALDVPVRVGPEGTDQLPSFDDNLYWGDGTVGRWGEQPPLDLPAWQAECSCDAGSVDADPGLPPAPPLDPTPAAQGPAIDLLDSTSPEIFHGSAPDAGALEAPLVIDARIEAGTPDRVRLGLVSEAAPPLRGYEGCVGLTVRASDEVLALDSCEVEGSELVIRLVEPAVGGTDVTLDYADGTITDSASIGGRLGAHLRPFTLVVANDAPLPSADDTAGASAADGGTAGLDDGAGDAGDGDGEGCSCRSGAPGHPLALAWLLLLARRARAGARRARAGAD